MGFLCNQFYEYEQKTLVKNFDNGQELWIGFRYYLWETYDNEKKYITWIYNNHNNEIILEVTPIYPYRYCNKKQQRHYTSYKKWIETYQPYLIETLSHEKAQQWLDIAEHFIKTVEDNEERWEEEYKLSQNK